MGKYNILVHRNLCPVCDEIHETMRKNEKSHPRCRAEYYKRYYKEWNRRNRGGKFTHTRHSMARRTWYIEEHVCVVPECGYSTLTRDLTFYSKDGVESKIKLCPKHLFEYKCGFLDEKTWLRVDRLKDKEEPHAQSAGSDEGKGPVGAGSQHEGS